MGSHVGQTLPAKDQSSKDYIQQPPIFSWHSCVVAKLSRRSVARGGGPVARAGGGGGLAPPPLPLRPKVALGGGGWTPPLRTPPPLPPWAGLGYVVLCCAVLAALPLLLRQLGAPCAAMSSVQTWISALRIQTF
jgi:hypothetical protein